ncbi:MAG: hypothetical protein ACLQLC_05255 [Candidatus Sulfotelmatobacter sp.]
MKGRGSQFALVGLAGLLLVFAAYFWLSYMAQGIAYGDIVGLPGRERELATLGSRAMRALRIAVVSEALAVATISWVFTDRKAVWVRLVAAVGLAAAANILTLAAVRGF